MSYEPKTIDLGDGYDLTEILFCPHEPHCDPRCEEPGVAGWNFRHPTDNPEHGNRCGGAVYTTNAPKNWAPHVWTIVQADPLTLSPSIVCQHAGRDVHGWVRDGKWVPV